MKMLRKKIVCIMLVFVMVVGVLPAYAVVDNGVTEPPLFNANTLIEFENGYLPGTYSAVKSSRTASGHKCAMVTSGRLDNPPPEYAPDMSYKITIPSDGKYYIYMRYFAANTGTDSVFVQWDHGQYVHTGIRITDATWEWTAIVPTDLTAGEHDLSFLHRESGMLMDAFVVTTDPKTFDTSTIEQQIGTESHPVSPEFAVNSTAVTIDLVNGFGMIEGEDATLTSGVFRSYDDENASGGEYATAIIASQNSVPNKDLSGLEFNFNADVYSDIYVVWARVCIPSGGNDSTYISLDGDYYKNASNYGVTLDGNGTAIYEWRRLGAFANIAAGTKHNFRIYPREGGSRIDKILISNMGNGRPYGMGEMGTNESLPADEYPMPTIFPPANQHPRLYFTASDIPDIKANLDKPQNATAKADYEAALQVEHDGELRDSLLDNYTNYNSSVMRIIEAYAFKYAIDGDETYGIKAKNAILNFMSTVTFDQSADDISRQMGHVIFLGAEVYDWCYDLFDETERNAIIIKCEEIGTRMEISYPPKSQGAVCGHAGEAQLLRDLLGFAIATYDERPDIYNYVGGRFFSQFIEPRNFWYESSTHHQGDAYGSYRYYWEVIAQMLIYNMTGGKNNGGIKPFNDTQGDVPYFWIYTRRPDGQMFRTGDCYNEKYVRTTYWNSYIDPMYVAGNFYGDQYIKGEYNIENPNDTYGAGMDGHSGVFGLIFNNPDLEGITDKSELPLTKYFASPNGMMVARTGWNVTDDAPAQSSDVVAMMKIGERWGANHHHLDAGNFQLYYKGILASESGYYESYGTLHDQNYNKASIAHNVLTIYDPNEKFNGYSGTDNNGNVVSFPNGVNDGGQRRPGGEPATMEIWSSGTYDTGVVLDHEFGPDKKTPAYTYIKGDITKAYNSSKVSNVMRSMAFMPLDNPDYPALMVIMDKVTSTNPTFKKKWLLHTQREPEVGDGTAVVKSDANGYNGKLTLQTLLPKNASVTKIGGDGKRFWVGNQAGDFYNDGYNFDTQDMLGYDSGIEAGWGRIEVAPTQDSLSDKFLNVMAVSDADSTAVPLESELIEGTGLVGAKTDDKVLMFADTNTSNTDKNRVLDSASFTVPGTDKSLDIMVAGVKAGVWTVTNGAVVRKCEASEDGGVLYFNGDAGAYELTYMGENAFAADITNISTDSDATTGHVTVTLDGLYEGAQLIAAAFDSNNRLIKVGNKVCTAESTYTFDFLKASLPKNIKEVKIFLWDGEFKLKPISKSKTISVNNMFSY